MQRNLQDGQSSYRRGGERSDEGDRLWVRGRSGRGSSHGQSCDILFWRMEDEDAAYCCEALEDWLEAFPGSIICTSHFSPFLDKMCTHIIDFQDRKLKTFKGVKGTCLTQFVEKYPEKKAYFELSNETMRFTFPEPGAMEGVKSRSKVILRMNNVTFTYPTKTKPTIMGVNLTVSQVSRVAVIGANGAGKSTAIKVLVGEQKPTEGSIWKASGLRMAYVAQHAFHHLEKHMQRTPTDYIMWRFAGNDDRESLEFKSTELSVDEEKARATKWCIDSVSGSVRRCTDAKEDPKKAKQDEAGQ